MSWTELIGQKGDILWWEMSIRTGLIFIFGLVLIRLFGRRAFGKQNPLDIVVAIIVGSSLSRALTGNAPFIPTLLRWRCLSGCFGFWSTQRRAGIGSAAWRRATQFGWRVITAWTAAP